ncbi:hypothetical protein M23134_03748 [Microscilla marina ATCC 23134]|uniref:Uncharacterized protein n=2 Tax=Microscilla marina TaxID=1027 RepID=A1ZPE1_MICM2|nr:hypothetical protein M23134_03748 [Microscilla marina ATCC 23134]
MLLQPMSKLWIVISFEINQDFIAKVLCINRSEPESACAGRCHLERELKDATEKEQKQIPLSIVGKSETFVCTAQRLSVKRSLICALPARQSIYLRSAHQGFIADIFHPPQFIA